MRTNPGLAWLSCAAVLVCLPPMARADLLPLWEVGAGFGALRISDYRGSDEAKTYVFPAPYLVYRGDIFRADRNGVRGLIVDSERVELSMSAGAAPPVDSSQNAARRGMPDLLPTVEFGPSLEIGLARPSHRRWRVDLRLPVRSVFSVDPGLRMAGWTASPRLAVDFMGTGAYAGWNLGFLAGPQYADRRYHGYYYSVAPSYASAERPAYTAPGGYAGQTWLVSWSRRFPGYWFGGFARFDALRGAVFADSPLVRRQYDFMAGFAISWIFRESGERVERDE